MNWQHRLTVGGVVVAALGSAAWVLMQRAEAPPFVDPTEVVSDAFDRWEQPAAWPDGLEVQDSVSCMLTAFTRSADSVYVYHSTSLPTALPRGWVSEAWQGGWILGTGLSDWAVEPGSMAAHWQPRSGGRTVQALLGDGTVESSFERLGAAVKNEKLITQVGGTARPAESVLAQSWADWYERMAGSTVVETAAVGAYPTAAAQVPDSLDWLVESAWLSCTVDGAVLLAYAGVDSIAAVQRAGSWENGVWYIPSKGGDSSWSLVPPYRADDDEAPAAFEFARWSRSESRTGRALLDGRLVWTVQEQSSGAPAAVAEAAVAPLETSAMSQLYPQPTGILGYARNHRSGGRMELRSEGSRVIAQENDRDVWSIEIESDAVPEVWEVDLYRNGKYQVAIGAGNRFHVIDVLGREVNGFPKRWSTGFSAFAVFDYDKNRQFRFLLAAPNGEVFNFRKEGERTPGWKFKAEPGRYIVSLSHLRIGPRDYIFASQDDGSVRILSRTGEDRFRSPVRVPAGQRLAFRLGKDLASSTVLYVDSEGWVQERTIGLDEPVGLSRMTGGLSVLVEDRTGDGIPEVVVTTAAGEELWDAGNQRLSN
ncbi:MAG: hypothetical protein ACPG08_01855 [Flavobacteriales bacterium]